MTLSVYGTKHKQVYPKHESLATAAALPPELPPATKASSGFVEGLHGLITGPK
jgi:hypothetical protein